MAPPAAEEADADEEEEGLREGAAERGAGVALAFEEVVVVVAVVAAVAVVVAGWRGRFLEDLCSWKKSANGHLTLGSLQPGISAVPPSFPAAAAVAFSPLGSSLALG